LLALAEETLDITDGEGCLRCGIDLDGCLMRMEHSCQCRLRRLRRTRQTGGYRPWAELLARTFAVDVLTCPNCQGRMRLLAVIMEPANIARYLAAVGEATEVPRRTPGRGPPYWKMLRRQALGDEEG
jgi:hypothetical protein